MNNSGFEILYKIPLMTGIISLFLWSCKVQAQVTTLQPEKMPTVSYSIEWVCYYPDTGRMNEKSLMEKFSRFLFGEEPAVSCIKPISVFAKDTANFWILDQGYKNIIEIRDGMGKIPFQPTEGFPSLVDICNLPDGSLLFTDSKSNMVFRFDEEYNEVTEFILSEPLSQPTGIGFSAATAEIWIIETAAHRIAIFDQQGNWKRYIGKRGIEPLTFNFPTFIWIDDTGLIYIVDSMNFRIQIINTEGELISSFGEAGNASGYFARPKGIATDSHGNIYVVDALFHAVQIFDRQGRFLYSFGGQGRARGEFWMPTGIYIDDRDFIYVADSYNSRVQVFELVKKQAHEKNY